jgi:hypothetical protein
MLAVLTLAGCGGSSGSDSTQATQTAATTAVSTPTATAPQPARTATEPEPAPGPPPPTGTTTTPSQPSGAPLRFSGNGLKKLGDFSVPRAATLRWTNSGPTFALSDAALKIKISSGAHSGSVAIPAGRYRSVEVDAAGRWTFVIRPR